MTCTMQANRRARRRRWKAERIIPMWEPSVTVSYHDVTMSEMLSTKLPELKQRWMVLTDDDRWVPTPTGDG